MLILKVYFIIIINEKLKQTIIYEAIVVKIKLLK
jgi:hypothetical protein